MHTDKRPLPLEQPHGSKSKHKCIDFYDKHIRQFVVTRHPA